MDDEIPLVNVDEHRHRSSTAQTASSNEHRLTRFCTTCGRRRSPTLSWEYDNCPERIAKIIYMVLLFAISISNILLTYGNVLTMEENDVYQYASAGLLLLLAITLPFISGNPRFKILGS